MNALVSSLLRSLAPVVVSEARVYLASAEGKRVIADAKALLLDVVRSEIATAAPLRLENSPRTGTVDGEEHPG